MVGLRVPNGQPVYFSTGTILVNKFYKTITEMSGLLRAIYLIGSQFKPAGLCYKILFNIIQSVPSSTSKLH